MQKKRELERAREAYSEMGGIESDLGPRDDPNDAAADMYTYHDTSSGVSCSSGGKNAPLERQF